jgi:hypothetical protein
MLGFAFRVGVLYVVPVDAHGQSGDRLQGLRDQINGGVASSECIALYFDHRTADD